MFGKTAWRPARLGKVALSVAAGIGLAAALGISYRDVHDDHRDVAYGGCPVATKSDAAGMAPVSLASTTGHASAALPAATLKIGQTTTLAFGRTTQPKDLVLYFSVTPPLPPSVTRLAVRVDTFRRNDDARLDARTESGTAVASDDDIQAVATPSGREIRLDVCFGRQGNRLGNPGTYAGSVTLTDTRLASEVSVPVTVTMQYIHGTMLLWALAAAVLPGAWLLWVTKRQKTDSNEPALSFEWFRWMATTGGAIAIATGTVAAFSVYVATYLKDPTWGSSPYQAISLYGAMFSAFVATSGIAHAGAQRYQTPPKTGATARPEEPASGAPKS